MKFLLIILAGHFIGTIIGRIRKTGREVSADEKDRTDPHPAEYQLRQEP